MTLRLYAAAQKDTRTWVLPKNYRTLARRTSPYTLTYNYFIVIKCFSSRRYVHVKQCETCSVQKISSLAYMAVPILCHLSQLGPDARWNALSVVILGAASTHSSSSSYRRPHAHVPSLCMGLSLLKWYG